MIFKGCGALVFVIDARDDYIEALTKLNKTVIKAHAVNTQIKFEVFIHKVDGISDDLKMETQRDIHQRATDDLVDAGYDRIHLSFHLTSIYDHSIFEAFSKVVQKVHFFIQFAIDFIILHICKKKSLFRQFTFFFFYLFYSS